MNEDILKLTEMVLKKFLLNILTKLKLSLLMYLIIKLKGFWYFDKRQGELKYRFLGICPVSPDV